MELKIFQQAEQALSRIRTSPQLVEVVEGADLVVEAVFEDLDLKRRIFADLDRLCPPHAILASNTSTFLPSWLAEATERPQQVLVTHYFNPPFLVPLVEIVPGGHDERQRTGPEPFNQGPGLVRDDG